ncbi:cobalt-zinc-cadmium efflux system protein [Nitrosomonas sp. PY1]|uniref:cation diffusion facilitator family transporter n=1 Tax=Nitrosomonas sp. PY1 TaxID=1803906 RepID=UPI001FC820BB|nr:cation diffusion facilitator family transporter [Nitrosomonas sp. PY1]GKS70557.1 cobalt-zinc-cadmium efflux system protein [Nitrosomonas sp. PY1]
MFDHSEKKHSSNNHHEHKQVSSHGQTFIITIILNAVYIIVEFTYGFIANSAALIADAGHNLSDVLALILAWIASILARKAPSERFTYGLRSSSILAALLNAMFLLVVCGGIAWEAFQRLSQPPVIAEMTVIVVSAVGILVNGFSALLFIKGSKEDINIRGAYLHMAADAGISLSVMIAGIGMMITGWYWIDPIVSQIIVVIIVISTWDLLRESAQLALNAVPAGIDVSAVDAYLRSCCGVTDIHDLHIWGMSTTENALTVHLVMPEGYPGDSFMDSIMQTLNERFKIQHSTLQIELGNTNHKCMLQPQDLTINTLNQSEKKI